ncbi:hypothetical protein C0036_11265, partial [Streptomyces sp. DJ]
GALDADGGRRSQRGGGRRARDPEGSDLRRTGTIRRQQKEGGTRRHAAQRPHRLHAGRPGRRGFHGDDVGLPHGDQSQEVRLVGNFPKDLDIAVGPQ